MEKENIFLSLENVEPRISGVNFLSPINWEIKYGEQWAVVGLNGSGKTLLANIIAGRHATKGGEINYWFWDEQKARISLKKYPAEMIRKVSFESAYLLADYKNMYYQQRFNAAENDLMPTVEEVLAGISLSKEERMIFCERLNITSLLSKHLIMLSSGELRRFLIALVLMQKPDLIIFDNPFIGLDKEMRAQLNLFFSELARFQQMIFLVPALNEIPDVATHILPVRDFSYGPPLLRNELSQLEEQVSTSFKEEEKEDPVFPDNKSSPQVNNYKTVLKMKNINISYNERVLFRSLNWEIKRGEKWALLGPNGSGKSTLLSLLVGDNPQAYAQDIEVFDRRRGSGESIWEIKRPIGYISSEMHLFFQENQPCVRIVGSGFFDTIGLFRACTDDQIQISLQWMKLLGIEYLADRSFLKLSSGEQRLVLLARTLVKNPELLILDEPFHGLDMIYKQRVRKIIERFCAQEDKTLIYVTHRREEIPSCVDHFFELKRLD